MQLSIRKILREALPGGFIVFIPDTVLKFPQSFGNSSSLTFCGRLEFAIIGRGELYISSAEYATSLKRCFILRPRASVPVPAI
jgi:hypothetical protein